MKKAFVQACNALPSQPLPTKALIGDVARDAQGELYVCINSDTNKVTWVPMAGDITFNVQVC